MSAAQVAALRARALRSDGGAFVEALEVFEQLSDIDRARVVQNRWPVVQMTATELEGWPHERRGARLAFVRAWDVGPHEFWIQIVPEGQPTTEQLEHRATQLATRAAQLAEAATQLAAQAAELAEAATQLAELAKELASGRF